MSGFLHHLLASLQSLKARMAALVAWIVGTISGDRGDDKAQDGKSQESKTKAKPKKSRQKPKKSPVAEPSFSTNLTTPIEEVIEETLNEETTSESKTVKLKKRHKSKASSEKEERGKSSILNTALEQRQEDSEASFHLVKDKRSYRKTQKPKKDELPKSSIIQHYKPKPEKKEAEKFVLLPKKPPEDATNFVEIVNKSSGKSIYVETKESKKVHSKISYARVASQRFEESLEQLRKEEEIQKVVPPNTGINSEIQPIENHFESSLGSSVEELASEIKSEEQRLVELLEEGLSKSESESCSEGEGTDSDSAEEKFLQQAPTTLSLSPLVQRRETEQIIPNETAADTGYFTNVSEHNKVITETQFGYQDVVEPVNQLLKKEELEELLLTNAKVESSLFASEIVENVESLHFNEFEPKFVGVDYLAHDEQLVEEKVSKLHGSSDTVRESKTVSLEVQQRLESAGTVEVVFVDEDNLSVVEEESSLTSSHESETGIIVTVEQGLDSAPNEELGKKSSVLRTSYQEVIEHISNSSEATELLNQDFCIKPSDDLISNGFHDQKSFIEEETLPPIIESGLEEITPIPQQQVSTPLDDFLNHERLPNALEPEVEIANLDSAAATELFLSKEIENQVVIEYQDSKPFKMSSGTQVRVLTLNAKEHQDSVVYRLEKNWVLQFRLGPSLLGRRVALYCNYPSENNEFNRTTYYRLKWCQDEGCNYADDTALLTEVTPTISGSFHYYFTYGESEEHQGSGFFLVDPVLKYGDNEQLPLDCIQCQTVLSKSLGPFHTWESKLKVSKESGYNMIHFTPIQELGVSNSSYSLSDQLKLNPIFVGENGQPATIQDVEDLIAKLRKDWKMTSICDIVLNHTANESKWLEEHPEVTYNCQNCPYMRPAYLLDAVLHQFSLDVAKGLYEDRGIPIQVSSEEHLNAIRHYLHTEVLANARIHELYTCNVNKYIDEFLDLARGKVTPVKANISSEEELQLVQDTQFTRLGSTVEMQIALKLYNVYRPDCFDEDTRVKKCAEDFKKKLEELNAKKVEEVQAHMNAAVDNVIAGIRYFRVQHDGPRIKEVSVKDPLVFRYFTDFGSPRSFAEHEEVMYGTNGKYLMAHNGWVMNSDPLRNFAAPGSNIYIRRELIAWGDSVKLRFGDTPDDCPFLWQHMKAYVEQMARIFDGVRLDNCHSTPIPVAEYLLDCARKVRPDLYVVAELFTNSDLIDNIFVNRLGITSLIREAMAAWDSHEQGRLVYRYGGSPVGSFYQPRIRPLVPSIAHALFLDLTHDNPSPVDKRSVFDLLPSSALVNMACCASGSNRGYDELVPHHIHVVDETRQYTEWTDIENLALGNVRYVTRKSGIIAAKKALNDLHGLLGAEGFTQVYVDQMDPDIVAVTRHCPDTHQSYVLVAFTAFGHPPEDAAFHQRGIKPLRVEGVLDEIVLEATLMNHSKSKYAKFQNFHKDSTYINGLSEYQVELKQHIQPEMSDVFEKVDSGTPNVIQLNFKNFKPGSVAVIKVSLNKDMQEAIENVRKLIQQFLLKKDSELRQVVSELTLPDLNRALYRCDQEERDDGHGFDTYNIPNFGKLVYAGLQGFMSLLSNIRPSNDLGHPMCANLRDGNWMIDYLWKRLVLDEGTKGLGQWIEENTESLKNIPRYLVPCYFDVIVTGIYVQLLEQSYSLMSDFVKNGSTFVKGLSLGSLQFAGSVKSADLPELSPNLADPKPPKRSVTLSAGLPHFSVGFMRNWGRDTFIALRGLFLLTGRFQDARYHILGYAACLRHGLIPNLLDGGRNPRFNCRDAIWWWLYCIKCYAEDVPEGLAILKDSVSRIFPSHDSPALSAGEVEQPLQDVIQEALTVHFQGLVFRERNAGRQIDEHMTDQGFNNQIGIHPETGFVFGGNQWNCGTWMDKMGSSDKAGNRGKPATPRDGSAVELIGLSKAVVTWLAKLHKEGNYPYDGVKRTHKNGNVTKWSFTEWESKIQNNFEKYFWVETAPVNDEIRPDLINKRGIYKDCFGASQEWTDFQLRCNFPVAMVAAPELFEAKHAWTALRQAEKYLLGPLGMKTLDPEDWAYNGDYDNSNDSDNFNVACGLNYHQGPEWVWPVGFFLRAKLIFAEANGELQKALDDTKVILSKHFVELQTSTWRGLPELTNKDGTYCNDSSRTQAWSMACILEVLHDLQRIEKDHLQIN